MTVAAASVLLVALVMLSACAPLPLDHSAARESSPPTVPADAGVLAGFADEVEAELTGRKSAYWLLDGNADSLRIRIALADLAAETLDIQYFIWQDDMTGRLLMQHVIDAADRGVRVRFLLDDLATVGRAVELAALAAHEHIELRLFNPWRSRSPLVRPLEFVARFGLLNHRMHNKVFVADGRFGIIGGRNIGDRYFGVYEPFVQNDIDLMIAGPLLDDVRESFEMYWGSALSYTVPEKVADDAQADPTAPAREIIASSLDDKHHLLAAFARPVAGWETWTQRFIADPLTGRGELMIDSPCVHLQRPLELYEEFKQWLDSAEHEVILSSPYLVPDDELIALIGELVARGVRVRIVTNSLASNSHVVAHSAYKSRRRALLATGAEVYEMRADAAVLEDYRTPPTEPRSLALHTKAAVIDGRWSFVGSPNVDPRSMILNTEIGVVVEDPVLAEELIQLLERDMQPDNAWRVTLEDGGWLKWWEGDEALSRQPATGFSQRLVEFFLNLLPIKSQT